MSTDKDIGGRLLRLRNILNLDQTAFAEKIGIGRSTLSEYEKGTHTISKKTVDLIELKVGINRSWLLEGEGEVFVSDKYKQSDDIKILDEQMPSYPQTTINKLVEQNSQLVKQVSDLIRMQLLNAETINNLSIRHRAKEDTG